MCYIFQAVIFSRNARSAEGKFTGRRENITPSGPKNVIYPLPVNICFEHLEGVHF